MGLYNTLSITVTCPRCNTEAEMEAEFRFGLKGLTHYHIGDQLRWDGRGTKTPLRRPKDGNYDDEAYAVCPNCERDFWLIVSVRNDVIVSAQVDTTRQAYIPDESSRTYGPDRFKLDQTNRVNRYNLEEVKSFRRYVIQVAKSILEERTGVIEGTRILSSLHHRLDSEEHIADFLVFEAIASQTDHLPIGAERKFWAEFALQWKDDEIALLEQSYREKVFTACRSLIIKWKDER